MIAAVDPGAIDDAGWTAARATLLLEMARGRVFAPHWKLVALHAFDRVRDAIVCEAALATPAAYPWIGAGGQDGRAPIERRDGAAGPVERTLVLLLAAAAAAAAEGALDRSRVFSALPPRPGEALLLSPSTWWSECYSRAVEEALATPGWTHMVEIDVTSAAESIGRPSLLADLERLGLPPAWLRAGRRLDTALGRAVLGRGGFLYDLMGAGALVTIALRAFDAPFAGRPGPSFRLLDGWSIPARGTRDAAAVDAGMRERLAAAGLAANPRKSRIVDCDDLRAERRTQAAWRAAADGPAGARAILADPGAFGRRAAEAEEWALVTLGRAGDPVGLDRAIDGFAAQPWSARARALYLRVFIADRAVARRFERAVLTASNRLHPWQWMWGMAALWGAPALAPDTTRLVAAAARSARLPEPVRAVAAIVWARFATRAGWRALEDLAAGAGTSDLPAAIAFGFRYRPVEARRTILADWARRDRQVGLVAAAIDREPDVADGPDEPAGASDGA